MSSAASELESRIGYTFRDASLLKQALTHRSFGVPHNERLEFLGDAMLNLAVARMAYVKFADMPEGDLSRVRANLVNQTSLASVAQALDIGTLLRLGEGEVKTGGASRASILADAVESLIGAVLLDGGEAAALAVVQQLFADKLDQPLSQGLQKDAKTALQEWLQARKYALPQYMVKRIEGAAHQQTFFVEAITERPAFKAEGQGSTRRIAEQDAAHKILLRLAERGQQ